VGFQRAKKKRKKETDQADREENAREQQGPFIARLPTGRGSGERTINIEPLNKHNEPQYSKTEVVRHKSCGASEIENTV